MNSVTKEQLEQLWDYYWDPENNKIAPPIAQPILETLWVHLDRVVEIPDDSVTKDDWAQAWFEYLEDKNPPVRI